MRQLITYMIEDPRTISQAIEPMFVAKSVERIGDHAKNIAEYVVHGQGPRRAPHQPRRDEREATAERRGSPTELGTACRPLFRLGTNQAPGTGTDGAPAQTGC